MNKNDRALLLSKTNGRCGYCGTPIDGIKWHADHMEPVLRKSTWINGKFVQTGDMNRPQNDHIGNMIASCPECNILKSSQSVEMFRETVSDRLRQLERQCAYRTAKRYGMIQETNIEIVFYFEQISK
ncbi:HNH endonuclease signature motif containing protein [Sulfuricurvum sp.]|uniref:HNH endonuclease n=1 Tax=Sulfuricurvum sp. TaxID=2025608 RepID=UPI002E2F86E4|nr:HNH endonuclease signature motif containing protein [Sulfuricurvum sp.]HEX5328854.1 HNH endonuclease signature motif containing protein [Sulfuricurvum sp.]